MRLAVSSVEVVRWRLTGVRTKTRTLKPDPSFVRASRCGTHGRFADGLPFGGRIRIGSGRGGETEGLAGDFVPLGTAMRDVNLVFDVSEGLQD